MHSYKIILTLMFTEPGNPNVLMNTEVLEFHSEGEANVAYEYISLRYPLNAIHATAIKLY